jgi:hypothetical protein
MAIYILIYQIAMSNVLIVIFYKINKVYMYTISQIDHNLYKKVHYDTIVSFYTRLVILANHKNFYS